MLGLGELNVVMKPETELKVSLTRNSRYLIGNSPL